LSGGDLRSIGKYYSIVAKVKTQEAFDELFKCMHYPDRVVVMRTADCVEKITATIPAYLEDHKREILELSKSSVDKELVWHLAQIIPRLNLAGGDFKKAWNILCRWALDKSGSRIVRVNSIAGLCDLAQGRVSEMNKLTKILAELEQENIPSLTARIKRLKKNLNS